MNNIFTKIFLSILIVLFLSFLFKGQIGNPYVYQQNLTQDLGGPFESSNSNSRYALVKAIVENKSVILNINLAKLSSPDVTKYNGHYYSIFTPGISFLAIPLYIFGKSIHLSQVTTYSLNILFSLVNLILIYSIIRKLKFGFWTALFSGSVFILATNAFTYAGTLTQHHAVTAGLLSLILISFYPISLFTNLLFGLIWGTSLLMDIPFATMSIPVLISFLYRHYNSKTKSLLSKINWRILISGIGLIPPLILFGYYNFYTTGSYFSLSQFVGRTSDFNVIQEEVIANDPDVESSEDTITHNLFSTYKPRKLILGLYTLLISDERSIFYYSPVLIISILGLYSYFRSYTKEVLHPAFVVAIFGLISYAMFGDPWGGWSFGPRYLIPASAILCLFIPFSLVKLSKYKTSSLVFIILIVSSVYINSLGAITTNLIPPKQEADFLSSPIPHNYLHNWQLINSGNTHSLMYILLFSKYLSPLVFYVFFAGSISLFLSVIYLYSRHENSSQA